MPLDITKPLSDGYPLRYNGQQIPVQNLEAKNIKKGTRILGVAGELETDYERPSDWLTVPELQWWQDEVYILNAVYQDGLNMIYFEIKGSGTIDWGDGQSEDFDATSTTRFSHHYNYDDLYFDSWTSHNNSKQALIHIYGESGAITEFSLAGILYKYTNDDGIETSYGNYASSDILEIKGHIISCELKICSSSNMTRPKKLESFEWDGVLTNTSLSSMFYQCTSLQKVVLPEFGMSSATNCNYMFSECPSLKKAPWFDTSKITTMFNMFKNDYSLQSIPNYDISNVTNMDAMIDFCYSLQTFEASPMKKATTFSGSSLYAMQSVEYLNTSRMSSISSIFSNSASLQSINDLDASRLYSVYNAFSSCTSLKGLRLYNLGAGTTGGMTLNVSFMTQMTRQACLDLFNSLKPNNENYSRTLTLGSTLGTRLMAYYVKDSGVKVKYKVVTSDTTVDPSKQYYWYAENFGQYILDSNPDLSSTITYFEEVEGAWNRYDFCPSSDPDGMLVTDYVANVLKWTVTM